MSKQERKKKKKRNLSTDIVHAHEQLKTDGRKYLLKVHDHKAKKMIEIVVVNVRGEIPQYCFMVFDQEACKYWLLEWVRGPGYAGSCW